MSEILSIKGRSHQPRSVHIYAQTNRSGWFIANLRFADGRLETVHIPDEREALALAALWSEQGAGVTLGWIDPYSEAEEGPGGAA
jgi:hypothetical protein